MGGFPGDGALPSQVRARLQADATGVIAQFSGSYRFLSNFFPAEVVFDGEEYPSVEHAYQAAKTFDLALRQQIQWKLQPGAAKRLAYKIIVGDAFRPDWDDVRIDVMRGLLAQKFAPGAPLADRLRKTGDKVLIEGNTWNDRFWGVCKGEGQNWLGRLLMERREQLRT